MNAILDIINGDALEVLKTLAPGSVHCCVTSPPYYGLRDYKVEGQIGLEKTPEEYVARLVEIFRELRRVLRDDGTFWLNIGDSYAASSIGKFNGGSDIFKGRDMSGHATASGIDKSKLPGIKPKDLIGIPWLLAFALRADGWYLRADLPWIKRNSMPSSVKDRPSSSIEHVFLFSKSQKYYYDYVATMQPSSESYNKDKRPRGVIRQCVNAESKYPDEGQFKKQDNTGNNTYTGFNDRWKAKNLQEKGQSVHSMHIKRANGEGEAGSGPLRFMRDSDFFFRTWQGLMHNEDGEPMALVVNPRGYKGAHFACFPVQLVEPMILASTSERGVCPECGAPWVREIESKPAVSVTCPKTQEAHEARGGVGEPAGTVGKSGGGRIDGYTITTGWHPTCSHNLEPVPATTLDPFSGSAATGVACNWHNRGFIGIELKPDYIELGKARLEGGK